MKSLRRVKARDELARKLLKVSYSVAILFFGVLVIFNLLIPSTHGGWSDNRVVDYIIMSGFMVGFASMVVIYGFQAWTKNEEEYYRWLISIGLLRKSKMRLMSSFYSKGTYFWSARLISILALLFVCAFVVFIAT